MRESLCVRLWVRTGMHVRTTACMRLRLRVDACPYGCAQIIFACGHACMFVCRLVRFRVCPWVSVFLRLSTWSVNKCAHGYFLKNIVHPNLNLKYEWLEEWMIFVVALVRMHLHVHGVTNDIYIPWFILYIDNYKGAGYEWVCFAVWERPSCMQVETADTVIFTMLWSVKAAWMSFNWPMSIN